MSQGLYSHTTRATGTILTAAIYNADHTNHITNQNPAMTGALADTLTEYRSTADPGGSGSEILAGSLAGELQRLRYALNRIVGKTYWYEAPAISLETIGPPDATLTAFAALVGSADKVPYFTGVDAFALATFTAAARTFVAAVSAAAQTALLDALVGDSGSGGTKGLVPAPAAGDAAAGKYLKASGAWAAPSGPAPDIIIEDQQAANTAGPTYTSGADRTVRLNTEVRDALGIASVASNQITLSQAGTYAFRWAIPITTGESFQSILRDVTGSADLKRGMTMVGNNNAVHTLLATGYHVATFAGARTIELRIRIENATSTQEAANFGTEVYAEMHIWKLNQ